jgi:hypothetical protein
MLCTGVGNLIMVSGYIFQPLCRDVELDLSKMKKKENLTKLVMTGLQRKGKAGARILMFPRVLGM